MSERRPHEIRLTLDDDELARLDEMRPAGQSRPSYLRQLLRQPPKDQDVASRGESLAILTGLARDGRVAAAIALERALRESEDTEPDDLEALLRDD